MIRPQRYFPWKVARQLYLTHFGFIVFALVVTGFSIRYQAYLNFVSASDIHEALGRFDHYLTSLFFWVMLFAAIYLVFASRSYARPLGRMIQRARELRRLDAKVDVGVDPEELNEEPGEWFDLERALNRIHRDLKAKTEALSREREELTALIGAVSDAILAIDREGEVLFFNSPFALLFSVNESTTSPQAKTPNIADIFRVPEVLEGYREVLATGQMKVISTSLRTATHAMPRHFSISLAPLRPEQAEDEQSVIDGAVGVFHDVTELKQSEQIRIEFVGNASHELRTPLTSIKGYVETLRDDLKNKRYESGEQFLNVISRNVDRLILLVNDLLDLSSLDSGAELTRSNVQAREISDAVIRQLDDKRSMKSQVIHLDLQTEALSADARRFEQVLLNLVHNAIKYTPEGSRIDIALERAPGGSVLRVKDNGPGIPLEHQSRLFERFFRVDPGRSREQGGTGLGLSIVKHIMLKHGGSARLVSHPGMGAEFICFFPD